MWNWLYWIVWSHYATILHTNVYYRTLWWTFCVYWPVLIWKYARKHWTWVSYSIHTYTYIVWFTSINEYYLRIILHVFAAMDLVSSRNIEEMVLVLKKEVSKTHNVEHEDTGKYRQLLVRTLHACCIKVRRYMFVVVVKISRIIMISVPGCRSYCHPCAHWVPLWYEWAGCIRCACVCAWGYSEIWEFASIDYWGIVCVHECMYYTR